MQAQALTVNALSDRDLMRALIGQQTKEFESKHGQVKTQDIIKKSDSGGVWVKPAMPIVEKKK
jgi:hypothetical protein